MENKQITSRGERQFYISSFPQLYQAAYGFSKGGTVADQADRSAMFQPNGVTLTRTATGTYTLKHNLGTQKLIMFITPMSPGFQARYTFTDNNNIQIETLSGTGVYVDSKFAFVLFGIL